jgi:hypothetical protein
MVFAPVSIGCVSVVSFCVRRRNYKADLLEAQSDYTANRGRGDTVYDSCARLWIRLHPPALVWSWTSDIRRC